MSPMPSPRADRPVVAHRIILPQGPIEYTDTGEGTAAVLALHGGMGGHDQSLLLARSLFAAPTSRRVIAVSRPGYLGTPRASGTTFAGEADLCVALLDRLGIGHAVVAAVSAGGPAAIAFAARHPVRTAGLILVSTPSGAMATPDHVLRRLRRFEILCRVPAVPALLGWLNRRRPERAAIRSIRDADLRARTLAHPEAGPLMAALQRSVFDRLAERLPGTLADTRVLAAPPPLPLAAVAAPTLIIHGEADAVVPFVHGERSVRAIAGAELLAVPDGEHVCLFTHLDLVRTRVAAFLARIDDRSKPG